MSTLFVNAGITDRLDIGVAAPFVRLTLDGSRVNTYRGRTFTQAVASAATVGLADLLARTNYTVYEEEGALAYFADAGGLDFGLGRRDPVGGAHVAFECDDRPAVDAFHAAALDAGGRDNGPPGIRAQYDANYYAAYVLDPDGNNIEAVCHHAPS